MQKINRCMKCMLEKGKGRFCRNCGYDGGSQNPERALPVGTILNNKYMIGAVIGEGGFGITYAAWDMLIETPIAIKEYFPSEVATRDTTMHDGEFNIDLTLIQGTEGEQRFRTGNERFVQEAEKLARFQKQPGVVCVKDFFYANNTAYMVMEYIRGTTLKTYLDSHGDKLSVEETLKMMEPVMRTLEEIHRAGVIHRDISPDNIMVTEDDQIKLIDFGVAKFMDAGDEKSMTLMLKHGYAPEEQYRSDGKQGTWTDVYALSAVMYRMLTGKAPEEITRRMVERSDAVHKELATVPGLSVQVRHGIEKGLAMKADKRYQTIGALYNGIYGRRKMQTGQWVIAGGIVAAAVVCMVFGGMIVRKSQELERNLPEVNNIQEEADTQKELVDDDSLPVEGAGEVNEGVEEEPVEEVLEEPENIRALREYYNDNCLGSDGKVYFVDVTGDEEVEMIDLEIENNMVDGASLWGTQRQSMSVYQYANDAVEEIYHVEVDKEMSGESSMVATETNYYLSVGDGRGVVLAEHCTSSGEQVSMEQTSFEPTGDGSVEWVVMPEGEFREKRRHSILLLDSFTAMTPAWRTKEMLKDYQVVLDSMEKTADVIDIAEASRETVLDYSVIYNGDAPCIFAVTGEIQNNRNLKSDYIIEYYENGISVWASHDGQVEKIEDDSSYDGYWMGSEIYQFGKSQHYFLLVGSGGAHYLAYAQHKFCYENNDAYKINSENKFYKNGDGTVSMAWYHNVEELDGGYLLDENGGEVGVQGSIGIFFYDHQYVEYGTEKVDTAELEGYENYNEILQVIEESFKEGLSGDSYFEIGFPGEDINYYVQEIELDHVRKSVNNVYYLNYKVYGRRREDIYVRGLNENPNPPAMLGRME